MTLIYKKEIETKKHQFAIDKSQISLIINDKNNINNINNWFKGSRGRGFR